MQRRQHHRLSGAASALLLTVAGCAAGEVVPSTAQTSAPATLSEASANTEPTPHHLAGLDLSDILQGSDPWFAGRVTAGSSGYRPPRRDRSKDPDVILRRIARTHAPRFRPCFAQRHPDDPPARLTLVFERVSDSDVVRARAEGSKATDHKLANCISAQLSAARFPAEPGRDEVSVRYPMVVRMAE